MKILPALLLFAANAACGAEFGALQADRSSVSFVSKQMNVPVEGAFRKFSADIHLDPNKPETGRASVEIQLASVDTGSTDADDELRGRNWFNVREFPVAGFVSTAVRPLGGGRFEAAGKMTIRGRTLDLRAPFAIKQEQGVVLLDGSFPLKRLDYAIGTGSWGDTSVVADEVLVKFHLVLKQPPQPRGETP